MKAAADGEDCEWPLCLPYVRGQRQRLVFESTVIFDSIKKIMHDAA